MPGGDGIPLPVVRASGPTFGSGMGQLMVTAVRCKVYTSTMCAVATH